MSKKKCNVEKEIIYKFIFDTLLKNVDFFENETRKFILENKLPESDIDFVGFLLIKNTAIRYTASYLNIQQKNRGCSLLECLAEHTSFVEQELLSLEQENNQGD